MNPSGEDDSGEQPRAESLLFNPHSYDPSHFDDETRRLLRATIDWFEQRGKERLLEDYRECNATLTGLDPDVLDTILEIFVRDFSALAVELHGKASSTEAQQQWALANTRKPVIDTGRFERVWEQVEALSGAYLITPDHVSTNGALTLTLKLDLTGKHAFVFGGTTGIGFGRAPLTGSANPDAERVCQEHGR
jgi:hypothetical protein